MLFTLAADTQVVQPLIYDANTQAGIELSLGAGPVSPVTIPDDTIHISESLVESGQSRIKTLI